MHGAGDPTVAATATPTLSPAPPFSDDRDRATAGAKRLIDLIAGSPVWPALRDATTVPQTWGRRRGPGQWAAIYLTFAISGHVDVEPWWAATNDGRWSRAAAAASATTPRRRRPGCIAAARRRKSRASSCATAAAPPRPNGPETNSGAPLFRGAGSRVSVPPAAIPKL